MNKFEVGQKVMMTSFRGPSEVEVVRVGRKLVYIAQYGREQAFYIEDGSDRGKSGGVGYHIYTLEEWAERQRLSAATKRLAELGIRTEYSFAFKNDADVLEALIAVVDAASSK